MKKMKMFCMMLIMICLIQVCCTPFTSVAYAVEVDVWDFVTNPIGALSNLVEEILVELLLPLGDGVLYMVSSSVGEVVTTDSIIFNNVKKLNINFWDKDSPTAIKGMMQSIVEKWYDVFFKIAVMVYVAVLVVAGIQVLLHSTAEKTAQYKEYLVSWVTGVAILCLFPFAMKYIVMLSETAVTAVSLTINSTPSESRTPSILGDSARANEIFGEEEFLEAMLEGVGSSSSISVEDIGDTMLQTRMLVQQNKKLILLAIYFIMIGQMMVLLLMYYKRVFMLAFLITIFPLVAMTFAIDKMGDKKAQTFSIWFKEFVVNVVVQIFHAVVYVIVVNTAVRSYITSQGKNWLFMIISVLFLFKGEKVLRSIFGAESKANTLGDLAATAATYTAMKDMFKGSGSSSPATGRDKADAKVIENNQKMRSNFAINKPGGSSTGGSSSGGENAGGTSGASDSAQSGGGSPSVDTRTFDAGAAMDNVAGKAMKHRVKNGIASGLVKRGFSASGRVLGATYGLSKGNADGKMASNVASSSLAGSKIAKGATAPITTAINKAEREVHGRVIASSIMNGSKDEELGLNVPPEALLPADVNPDEVVGQNGETMQQIYREALAEMAKATARGGKAKGEIAYWNYMRNNIKK